MLRARSLTALVAGLAFTWPLQAQSPAPTSGDWTTTSGTREAPPTLTRDAAIERAERRSFAVRSAELQASASRIRARSFLARLLPSTSASISTSVFGATTVTGEDDFGQPRSLDEPLRFRSSSSSQSLGVSWTVLDGGRRWHESRIARDETAMADAQVALERLRVRNEVGQLYREAVRARLSVAVQRSALVQAQGQREVSERLFRLAVIDRVDLIGAQAQERALQRSLALEELNRQRADMMLSGALLLDPGQLPPLDTVVAEPFDPESIADRLRRALEGGSHPSVAAAEAKASAAARSVRLTGTARWPQVSAFASVSRAISLTTNEALWEPWPRNRSYYMGFNISLPIGGAWEGRVAQRTAALSREAADVELERVRTQRQTGAAVAMLKLREAWLRADGARLELALQEERLEMSVVKFEKGAVSFSELQNIMDRAIASRRDLMESRIAFESALDALEFELGADLSR